MYYIRYYVNKFNNNSSNSRRNFNGLLWNERHRGNMIYTECTICGCSPKPDEWSAQVIGACIDCG